MRQHEVSQCFQAGNCVSVPMARNEAEARFAASVLSVLRVSKVLTSYGSDFKFRALAEEAS